MHKIVILKTYHTRADTNHCHTNYQSSTLTIELRKKNSIHQKTRSLSPDRLAIASLTVLMWQINIRNYSANFLIYVKLLFSFSNLICWISYIPIYIGRYIIAVTYLRDFATQQKIPHCRENMRPMFRWLPWRQRYFRRW